MPSGPLATVTESVSLLSGLPASSVSPSLSPHSNTRSPAPSAYQRRKLEVRIASGLTGFVALVAMVLTGMTRSLEQFWRDAVAVDVGVLFGVFLSLGILLFLLRAPFAWYSGIVLEREAGLLNQSLAGWAADAGKAAAVATFFGAVVLLAVYQSIVWFGPAWWLPVAAFLFLFNLLTAFIAPKVLLPLFYTLDPLDAGPLRDRLTGLCASTGVRSEGVYVIGFREKTKKANAALTGIGSLKRIVLSDTLIENLTDDEVEAVLAHEIAHLKLRHHWWGLVSGAVSSFIALGFVAWAYAGLTGALGAASLADIAVLPLLGALASVLSLVLSPALLWWSRRQEYAADRYAARVTGEADALARALEKLGRVNIADPEPHPLLEALTYSHPSLRKRIAALSAATA